MLGGLELDESLDAGEALLAGLYDGARGELLPHDAGHLNNKNDTKEKKTRRRKKKAAGRHTHTRVQK